MAGTSVVFVLILFPLVHSKPFCSGSNSPVSGNNVSNPSISSFSRRNIWPGGKVPYLIDNRYFTTSGLSSIFQALSLIERQSCIRFYPVNTALQPFYLVFTANGSSCSALVGRRTYVRPQVITLPWWCLKFRNVVHELVHALGFGHEQCRHDRSNHVTVNWNNIDSEWWGAFEEDSDAHYLLQYKLPYDYRSILHYGPNDFSKDTTKPSINSKSPFFPVRRNEDLSALDVLKINLLYNCSSEIRASRQRCVDFMPDCVRVHRIHCERDSYLRRVCRRWCNSCSAEVV